MPLKRHQSPSKMSPKRVRQRVLRKGRGLHAWESLGHGVTGLEQLEARALMAADLGIAISDAHVWYMPGTQTTYTVEVTNLGDATATNATVTTALASQITQATWTAAYSSGSSGPVIGAGNLNTPITLAAGGKATFTVVGTIGPSASGDLVSTANVALAGESNTANNSASDTDTFAPKLIVVTDAIGLSATSAMRLVNPISGAVVNQFFAFDDETYNGGVQAVLGDFDGDGRQEVAAAAGRWLPGEVRFFKTDGTRLPSFDTAPFGASWQGGVNLAAADVDGDGRDDLIAAKASGNGEVRIFRSVAGADPIANTPFRTIRPFGSVAVGGATVAAADMGTFTNGAVTNAAKQDGKAEVIIGSGMLARPVVRVYDVGSATPKVVDTINPFTPGNRGGIGVAAARVNADSIPEIIVTNGTLGRPVTEIYDGRVSAAANARLSRFEAFGSLGRANSPVFAAAIDTDGDGRADSLYASQGYRGAGGVKTVSTAGVATGSLGSLTGNLQLAAPVVTTNPGIVTTPTGLQFRDLIVGTGTAAAVNKKLSVNYTGWQLNGTEFDSSRRPGRTPFEFTLGQGEVIKGWDEAMATMKVGGRRQLIIPANLAYEGVSGRPQGVLVFDVELLGVT
jgi:peptidylprolyl isomerase